MISGRIIGEKWRLKPENQRSHNLTGARQCWNITASFSRSSIYAFVEMFIADGILAKDRSPFRIVTDKLKSYGAAKRTILSEVAHDTPALHAGIVRRSGSSAK